jgi:hypothetical protein
MKQVSFYHKSTGMFATFKITSSDENTLVLNTPKDHIAIEGNHDHLSRCVDMTSGEVIEYRPQPPSEEHEWHDETKRWRLTAEAQAKIDKRRAALSQIAILEAQQPSLMRKIMLEVPGWASSKYALRQIEEQITELEKNL